MNFYRRGIPIIFLLLSFSIQALANNIKLSERDLHKATLWQKTFVQAELNDSGKEKIQKIKSPIGQKVELNIKGEKIVLILKAAIKDKLQIGPFSESKAKEVVDQINVN